MKQILLIDVLEKFALMACGLVQHFSCNPLVYNNDTYGEKPGNCFVMQLFPTDSNEFVVVPGVALSEKVLTQRRREMRDAILQFLTVVLFELIPSSKGLSDALLFAKIVRLEIKRDRDGNLCELEIEYKETFRMYIHPGFYLEKFPVEEWNNLITTLVLFNDFTVSDQGPLYELENKL